ncbi:unnamed protein product [Trichobilharzia regenti]|nr:unnamed protein product [Trichobilharzia regenti]
MYRLLTRLHHYWSKSEILKAGVYITIGSTITAHYLIQEKKFTNHSLFPKSVNAAEILYPPVVDIPNTVINNEAVHTLGVPVPSHLRIFEGYICAYDRRNRIPYWVVEHMNPAKLNQEEINRAGVDRFVFVLFVGLFHIIIILLFLRVDHGLILVREPSKTTIGVLDSCFILVWESSTVRIHCQGSNPGPSGYKASS